MFNDPTKLILNVPFTGDLKRHEQALRAIWGGALCVSSGARTSAELDQRYGPGLVQVHSKLTPMD